MVYRDDGAHVLLVSRVHPPRNTTVLWTIDGSWPQIGSATTTSVLLPAAGVEVVLPRTGAVNARFVVEGLPLPSLTMTMVLPVPVNAW